MSGNEQWADAALDEVAALRPEWGVPTMLEALAQASREGDEFAGDEADALARAAEMEES